MKTGKKDTQTVMKGGRVGENSEKINKYKA